MAKRSNRRRVSLLHPEAFEADSPISPRRADAHHGQESQNSTNRSDIRSQSYLVAPLLIRSCKPGDRALITLPNKPAQKGSPNGVRAKRDELSTAARPPASVRGALPGGRPWITLRLHADPPAPPPPPRSLFVLLQCLVARKLRFHTLALQEESIYGCSAAESGEWAWVDAKAWVLQVCARAGTVRAISRPGDETTAAAGTAQS